jgi:protein tyrosine/serine phosphatase
MRSPVGSGLGPSGSDTMAAGSSLRPSIYWLALPDGQRLAIMPRPRAGDWLADEVAGWKAEGVDIVVSLLEPQEIAELDLRQLPMSCQAAGIEFVSFPIPDRGVPESMREADRLVRHLSGALAGGRSVAVHCRAGIGRSALIAACVLARNGYDVDAAFDTIATARGVGVPDTEAQRGWVAAFLSAKA